MGGGVTQEFYSNELTNNLIENQDGKLVNILYIYRWLQEDWIFKMSDT